MRLSPLLMVPLVVLLTVTAPAAQPLNGVSVSGTVVDVSGGPVARAEVTITCAAAGAAPQQVETDPDGGFRLRVTSAGHCTLRVSAVGFASALRTVLLGTGAQVTAGEIRLAPAGVQTQVDVTASPALLDVRSSASTFAVGRELLTELPTARTLGALLNLAPGVTDGVAYGGTRESNAVRVEGVSLNERYYGGQWVETPYNWLEKVQVVAPGAPAEYGGFTGALVTASLRSGGRRWNGLGEYLSVRPGWTADNTKDASFGAQRPSSHTILTSSDASAQSGGPVSGWMSTFVGVRYQRHDDRPFAMTGLAYRQRTSLSGIVKGDLVPLPAVRIGGFIQGEATDITGASLSRWTPTYDVANDREHRKSVWSLNAVWHIRPGTVLDGRAGGFHGPEASEPHMPNGRTGPPAHLDLLTGVLTGNAPVFERTDASVRSLALTLSTHSSRWAGSHDFKFGVEFERSDSRFEAGYTGGVCYYDLGGEPYLARLWPGDREHTTDRRVSAYGQDRWQIFDGLTLDLGIRVDLNSGEVPSGGTVLKTHAVSPRAGVAWNLSRDHPTVLRAHVGRYPDMSFAALFAFADTASRAPQITAQVIGPGVFQEIEHNLWRAAGTRNAADLPHPHVDQLMVGLERSIWKNIVAELRYIRRQFGGFIGFVDPAIGDFATFTVVDPGPDGRRGTADDGETLTAFRRSTVQRPLVLDAVPGAGRHYDGVQAIVRRRLSGGWQVEASYSWSKTRGSVGNDAWTNAGFATLGPLAGIGVVPGLLNAGRPAVFDFSEAKAFGSYRTGWLGGFGVGAVVRWRVGTRWHRVVRVPSAVLPFVAAEPVNARRTPDIVSLDLRAEKTLPIPRTRGKVGVYVDLFNATNVGRATGISATSGPTFGMPTAWTLPRTGQLGVRFSF